MRHVPRPAAAVPLALAAIVAGLAVPPRAASHELTLESSTGGAVHLDLRYGDGSPFSYESYEIRPEGEEIPFQSGRTDANGRIAFAPGRAGAWRLTARSEDGHGVDRTFETTAEGDAKPPRRSWFDRYPRILAGVGAILGAFGFLQLWSSRRRTRAGGVLVRKEPSS